jgi:hypothetical protein
MFIPTHEPIIVAALAHEPVRPFDRQSGTVAYDSTDACALR